MIQFQELYQQYAVDVYRFAFWLCGNQNEAEGIASETFIRAWGNFDKSRTETVKAYLFMIARNLYLNGWLTDAGSSRRRALLALGLSIPAIFGTGWQLIPLLWR